jgi:ABC-type branched-subunit amino acid transport system substrate-binding protein
MKQLPVLVVLLALAATACSVSTPRHESSSAPGQRLGASGSPAGAAGVDVTSREAAADGSGAAVASGAVTGGPSAVANGVVGSTAGARSGTGATSGPSGAGVTASARAANGGPVPGLTASAPGVTKDTITVSVIAGFSGALAAMVTRAYDGLMTWQDDVNAAGGINGRKIVMKRVDHKETADGGVAACKEALSNGSYFALVPEGIDATLTAVSCLDAAGMPTLYYSATTDPKWRVAFADIVTSAGGGTAMSSYVRNVLNGTGKKVGIIYVNQASYKEMADHFVPEAKRLGLNVAGVESVEANQASFTAPLLRLKNAGVQILVISATTDAIGILRDARSMGYAPQFTGWGFQFDFVTEAGRNLFDGVAGVRSYATVDSPAFTNYAARMQARGRGRSRTDDLEGFNAYGHGLVMSEVLKRAGVNPTRQSFVAGAEMMKDYDNGVMGPFSWSPSDHVGSHGVFPTVCCNSDYTWKGQGPARTTF